MLARLVIFKEEIDIVLKRSAIHERAHLEKRLPIDRLRARALNGLEGAPYVAQVSRDERRLAGGNLKLAVGTLHGASRPTLK